MDNEIRKYCEQCKFYSTLGCQSTLICTNGNKFWAVDVQPVKRGRWIAENQDNRGYADCYTCTNCKNYVYTYTLMRSCEFDYCPNCGALMNE